MEYIYHSVSSLINLSKLKLSPKQNQIFSLQTPTKLISWKYLLKSIIGYIFTMGVRKGCKTGICPPPEIGTKKAKFLENVKSAVWFWLVGLILAMTAYLPMWHTAQWSGNMQLWACSSLNPLLCLQRQVAELASELFCYWPLLRNINMATNLRWCTSSHSSMRFAACNYWTQTSWQVM